MESKEPLWKRMVRASRMEALCAIRIELALMDLWIYLSDTSKRLGNCGLHFRN